MLTKFERVYAFVFGCVLATFVSMVFVYACVTLCVLF